MTSILPSPPARVAVVLVNWNGWRDAIECIDSLLGQSHAPWHLFLIDNDSQDGSIENILKWCRAPHREPHWRALAGVQRMTDAAATPVRARYVDRPEPPLPSAPADCQITLIRHGSNGGFAAGCNVGIRCAGLDAYDYFWLLNPDTVVHREALAGLLRRAQVTAGVGITGSLIRYYHSPQIVEALAGATQEADGVTTRLIGQGRQLSAEQIDAAQVEGELCYVTGASMLVSAAFIREVGLMQEDYFLYFEERDWAMRSRNRFALAFAPDSVVFHKSGANSSKVVPGFAARLYYRNHIRFVKRFFPERLGVARRTLAIELVRHLLRGRWMLARIVAATLLESGKIALQTPSFVGVANP
jgi:GT2 family glycosyltransferase